MGDENLTANENNDTIGTDEAMTPDAGAGKAPEDTSAGMQAIIDQQARQIEALIARNEQLTQQFEKLARSGVHPTDGQPAQQPDTDPIDHTGMTGFNGEPVKQMDFRDLGRELAKK